MLRFLRIRDFALIRELEVEFGERLTVLTGETGSGKSILIDAVGLLTGDRSSQEMIRSDCGKSVLEGEFSVAPADPAGVLMREAGIESEDGAILIRREISSNGRNRAFVNGTLVTLAQLKSLGALLVDIHGQREHQSLYDVPRHLEWLDRFAGEQERLGRVRALWEKLQEADRSLCASNMDEQQRLRRVDILKFQVEEIRRAGVRPGEREELENERLILVNREKLFGLTGEAYALLYENEGSILGQSGRLARIFEELAGFDPQWNTHLEALRDSIYRLEDAAYRARDYAAGLDSSAERLDRVEARLSELERLSAKYGGSEERILDYEKRCAEELERLVGHAGHVSRLSEELDRRLAEYLACAEELSESRRQAAERLARALRKEFRSLAMEKTALEVQFHSRRENEGSSRIPSWCGPDGVDRIEFLIAPNKGEAMRPLARIASGGELSRVMLAIKSLCGGGEPAKTLVFDEIETGIGGRVAEAVGRRMRGIAGRNQVLCVTHLPQIAAFADGHFSVRKEVVAGRTETFIDRLGRRERVEEMARMLGGAVITDTTRRHAGEMLARASGIA